VILAAGLSPARQQILQLDAFEPGEVNRVREAFWCASGKVLNVGSSLHHLGAETLTLSTQGGDSGASLKTEMADLGVPVRWVETAAATRVCTTILDGQSGRTTELVEETPAIERAELDAFMDAYRNEAERADVVVLSGSLPRGTPSGLYRDLLKIASGRAIVDFRGAELTEALGEKPFLVKPNREELAATVGCGLEAERDLLAAMREINAGGAEWVVVTEGPRAVYVTSKTECIRFDPPKAKAVNPIGCGDAMAAGIAWAIADGQDVIQAVRKGIAAAVDNLGRLLPARLSPDNVRKIAATIPYEHLHISY
jgi:1-phosphofructokinase family hexose kinase